MTPQHIYHELIAINSKLSRIFQSDAWLEILDSPNANSELEITIGNAMHHASQLKIWVGQAIRNSEDKEVA